jgi:excisionase family DNA binding protein
MSVRRHHDLSKEKAEGLIPISRLLSKVSHTYAQAQPGEISDSRFSILCSRGMTMNKLLSIEEAATLLGLKSVTIYKYRLQGTIPYIKLGSRVIFDPDELYK